MTLREALIRLMNVKSIVTIVLTLVFSALTLRGMVDAGQFLTVFTVIIAFYFGTQSERRSSREGG